jgi:hypothetical protein
MAFDLKKLLSKTVPKKAAPSKKEVPKGLKDIIEKRRAERLAKLEEKKAKAAPAPAPAAPAEPSA